MRTLKLHLATSFSVVDQGSLMRECRLLHAHVQSQGLHAFSRVLYDAPCNIVTDSACAMRLVMSAEGLQGSMDQVDSNEQFLAFVRA